MDSWPPGGHDPALQCLQRRYLPNLHSQNIPGLLMDPLLRRLVVVSSFGAESAVLLHYVSTIRPGIKVLFLDTGMHFSETITYRQTLEKKFDIEVIDVKPDTNLIENHDPEDNLYRRDPNACCNIRKTIPLHGALAEFDSWITGRKRFQSSTRAALPIIERDRKHIKVNPLAQWSPEDIRDYTHAHELPAHPLQAKGFPSIGCETCSRAVIEGEDPRAGRWPQMPDKVECGIHISPDGKILRRTNGK
ncbi:phosphoadenylyl-sulfate reductase [Salipiger sp. IMCC34102]|nr:phosphoadenylyl-sulfate reductase [Salipiger sp. IMCC34102]